MQSRFGHKAGHLVLHLGVLLHSDIGGYIAFPETPAGIFVNSVLIALPTVREEPLSSVR